jgi:hypothetical protein
VQGFFCLLAQGLHGFCFSAQGFLPAQGFFLAHGFFAAHGLHGFSFFSAHGLQGLAALSADATCMADAFVMVICASAQTGAANKKETTIVNIKPIDLRFISHLHCC